MRRGTVIVLAVGLALLGLSAAIAVYVGQSKVPAGRIERSVLRTGEVLERAWALPVALTFGRDMAWQSNGSVCGAASLANVFRSLGEPAETEAEILADATTCWFKVCPVGLTLDQTAELARIRLARAHSRRTVTVLRNLTPGAFRTILRDTNNPSRRYVVNFSRAPIFGAGVGHISPIGGYLEAEDLVLVLDVNEAFRPWLVESSRLFAALDTYDGDRKRGLLRIE